MAMVLQAGAPTNLTASGAVSLVPGVLIGMYVASTTSGTVVIRDSTTSSGGSAVTGTITPAVGWHPLNMAMGTGCYATLANTINVTFVFAPS